jgi:hypothetical protein
MTASTQSKISVDPESTRLLVKAANLNKSVALTLHEYYLTLSDDPTMCTLTIQLSDEAEHSVAQPFAGIGEAQEFVSSILSDFPVHPTVYCVQHFKRKSVQS